MPVKINFQKFSNTANEDTAVSLLYFDTNL